MGVYLTWATSAAGGAERSVQYLTEGIRKVRPTLDVDLYCLDVSPPAQREPRARLSAYEAALAAALDSESVLVTSHRTFLVDLPIARAAGSTVAVFFRTSGVEADHTRVVGSDGRLRKLPWAAFPWELLDGTPAFAPSRFAATNLAELSHGRVVPSTVFNPVPSASSPPVRSVTGCLLVAGRLAPFKRFDVAIEALAVSNQPEPISLTVAGEGTELEALQALGDRLGVGPRLTFIGWASDLPSIVAEHPIFIHTCAADAFGRVALEAAALGALCIVPEGSAVHEVLGPTSGALGYRPGSSQDLARAIREALDIDEVERRHRTLASSSAVARLCDPELVSTQLIHAIEQTRAGSREEVS